MSPCKVTLETLIIKCFGGQVFVSERLLSWLLDPISSYLIKGIIFVIICGIVLASFQMGDY